MALRVLPAHPAYDWPWLGLVASVVLALMSAERLAGVYGAGLCLGLLGFQAFCRGVERVEPPEPAAADEPPPQEQIKALRAQLDQIQQQLASLGRRKK